MITKEEFEKLFERDKSSYVFATRKLRLDWDKDHKKEDGYCREVIAHQIDDADDMPEILQVACSFARSIITSMGGARTPIHLSPGRSYTDGKTIAIDTNVFNENLKQGQQIDVFTGFGVHEVLHVLHTPFDAVRTIPEMKNSIFKYIFNVLEDERIEIACGHDYPGYTKYLEQAKEWMYEIKENSYIPATIAEKVLAVLFQVVRFPKKLTQEQLDELGDMCVKLKEAITPYPDTFNKVISASKKIYTILKEEFDKQEQERVDQVNAEAKEEFEKSGDELVDEKGEPVPLEELKPDKFDDSGKEYAETIIETIESSLDPTSKSETLVASAISEDDELAKALEDLFMQFDPDADAMSPLYNNTFISKPKGDERLYHDSLARVGTIASTLSRLLKLQSKDVKIVNKGTRSGHLDVSKLVEGFQGVDTIYERHGEVRTDKIAMILVVDESYSMVMGRTIPPKIQSAKDCCILLNEALSRNNNIELFIYGHTADQNSRDDGGSTDIQVYKEKGYKNRYALGSVSARTNNRDGFALREIAKRVRAMSQRPAVLFLMADGMPNAEEYSGMSAVNDVRKAVNELKRMNIITICISIEDGYDAKLMFDHVVPLVNMQNLAHDLGHVVKKVAKELLKVKVTMH